MVDAGAESALRALQRRQHGVFTRAQAAAAGVPLRTVEGRVRAGRYAALLPGVYCGADVPACWEQRALAGVLHVGGEAVLARWSAGRALGLDLPPGGDEAGLRLVVRTRTFRPRAGITVHRTRHLDPGDVTRVGVLPVTTPTRTICDLAAELGPVALRRLLRTAVRDRVTDADRLRVTCGRLGRVRGKRRLLALLDELSPLAAACRSELEHRFLDLTTRAGIPPTAVNLAVRDGDGRRRVIDAVWLPERLPVELDGAWSHTNALDRADDRRREEAILLTGAWRPFERFTWDDVVARPQETLVRLRGALAAASGAPLGTS